MSLHYLVKLELLITHVLSLSCYRKKLRNLSYLSCGLQFRQIWIKLLQCVGTIARESVN